MHALGWTREEAVQYMLAHTAASEENVRGEVNNMLGGCTFYYHKKKFESQTVCKHV